MSVDNVIAIAGAAESSGTGHSMALVIFGVLVSIPIIVWGSQMVLKLMDRFPIIITLGGMLLGWIAGTMAVTDPALVNPEVMPQFPKIEATAWCATAPASSARCWCWPWASGSARARDAQRRRCVPSPAAPQGSAGLRRMLLAVDGSESAGARRAARDRDARRSCATRHRWTLHLLNVQRPVSGDVSSFVAQQVARGVLRGAREEALAPARALLDAAGVKYEAKHRLGLPGETIAKEAPAAILRHDRHGHQGCRCGGGPARLGGAEHDREVQRAGVAGEVIARGAGPAPTCP